MKNNQVKRKAQKKAFKKAMRTATMNIPRKLRVFAESKFEASKSIKAIKIK